jgi:hypothetical protein
MGMIPQRECLDGALLGGNLLVGGAQAQRFSLSLGPKGIWSVA